MDSLFELIKVQTKSVVELTAIVDQLQKDNKFLQEQVNDMQRDMKQTVKDIVYEMHSKMIANSTDQLKLIARLSKDISVLRERLRNSKDILREKLCNND